MRRHRRRTAIINHLPRRALLVASLVVSAIALALVMIGRPGARSRVTRAEPIGLFTTLPILWAETGDIAVQLQAAETPHWVREELAARGPITPLDGLASVPGAAPLARLHRMVIAQPRPLGPQENVALDAWLRGGGRLLLFADPALTEDSAFALGDPRHPQAAVLLSPILTRWGLTLHFDEGQPFGEVRRTAMGLALPVNLPGQFTAATDSGCRVWEQGLIATCTIGHGRLVAVADAAVVERNDPTGSRRLALTKLLDTAFSGR